MPLPGCMVDAKKKKKKSLKCAELHTQSAHSDCVGMWSKTLTCAADLQSQIPQPTSLMCHSNNRRLHRRVDSCCLSWNCVWEGILWKYPKQPASKETKKMFLICWKVIQRILKGLRAVHVWKGSTQSCRSLSICDVWTLGCFYWCLLSYISLSLRKTKFGTFPVFWLWCQAPPFSYVNWSQPSEKTI